MRLLMVAALAVPLFAQDKEPKRVPVDAHPKVDQVKVDEAIKKGVDFLRKAGLGPWNYHNRDIYFHELVLLTILHAGDDIINKDDEFLKKVLKEVLDRPLHYNYLVVLKAMSLSKLDKEKYINELKHCAEHILDNQCKNGQWSYGEPVKPGSDIPTKGVAKDDKKGTQVKRRVPIQRREWGPETGDNSNTQYAALGVRACWEAGIEFPRDSIVLAKQWWEKGQRDDGGWCYADKNQDLSRGSMSAGAVASLCIYNFMLGSTSFKDNPSIRAGCKWLGEHFSVTENPMMGQSKEYSNAGAHYFYFMYGLERAGILTDSETFGKAEWYPDGANRLLETQRGDGSWTGVAHWTEQPVWDTCFAILFLRRATAPLIKTEPGKK